MAKKRSWKKLKPTNLRMKTSAGESAIKTWLTVNNYVFEREKEMLGLVSKYSKANLKFDFYIESHKVAIEFDGLQHFTPNNKYHGGNRDSFVRQKSHDASKNKYCKENDIHLLRISCFERAKLYRKLKQFFDDLNQQKETENDREHKD